MLVSVMAMKCVIAVSEYVGQEVVAAGFPAITIGVVERQDRRGMCRCGRGSGTPRVISLASPLDDGATGSSFAPGISVKA